MKSALPIVVLLFAAAHANAAIQSTFGQCVPISAPPLADFPALVGPIAQAWDEQYAVTGTIQADLIGNGSSTSPSPGVLFGTYDSHLIHWSSNASFQVIGGVNFVTPIVAVAWRDQFLDLTDAVWGAGPTTYPTLQPGRGFNGLGWITVSNNTLTFEFRSMSPAFEIEQVRVWTAAPAPGAIALAGFGGLLTLRRRR